MRESFIDYIVSELEREINIYNHIIFEISDGIDVEEFLEKVLQKNENKKCLLIDLSNQGENGRPNDETGLGTVSHSDLLSNNFIITKAINLQNTEQALLRYVFLTNHKKGFFITNSSIPKDVIINNPTYHGLNNLVYITINEKTKSFIKEEFTFFQYEYIENKEFYKTMDGRIIL